MTSLLKLKEKFTTIANYGRLIFSFSLFILTLSVIIYESMLYGISVILSYIMFIVIYILLIRYYYERNKLSTRERGSISMAVLFMLVISYFILTSNINSGLQVLILFIMLINIIDFDYFLDAIDRIRNSSSYKRRY
jgi:cation transport ATPase